MLEERGYEVLGPVTSIAAALAIVAHRRPDACVLDFNLRGEAVTPVARVLKAEGIPFLLSSAYEQTKFDGDIAFAWADQCWQTRLAGTAFGDVGYDPKNVNALPSCARVARDF